MSHQQASPASGNGQAAEVVPNPEVMPKAHHRQFTAEYKRRVLAEADACREPGQIGALLRREGLYSSHLTNWRKQRELGTLQALTSKSRGPKPDPLAVENAAQRREIERLTAKLQRAETIMAVQKKLAELLAPPTAQDRSDELP